MLNNATLNYMTTIDLSHRQALGQFFTPKPIRDRIVSYLPKIKDAKIAELNVGTGEFLDSIYSYFDTPTVFAYDIDTTVVNIARSLYPQAHYSVEDSLYINEDGFDFVIGNPPYFETSRKQYKEDFSEIVSGRLNIYALFVYKGLSILKNGGYLAMVVPTSMNNGTYFKALRKYILSVGSITQLTVLTHDIFKDAEQAVQLLVIRKGYKSTDFTFTKNDTTIFTDRAKELDSLWYNAASLKDLGYTVKTGNFVWNQHKDKLSVSKTNTLLLWAHNIVGGKIVLSTKKPQYINNWKPEYDKGIVVNRITGANNNAKLKAAVYNHPFTGENHVNVISGRNLEYLLPMLTDVRSLQALKLITGNTQLSKTELETLFPVYKERE
jgi:adenine-specific DNA-methyltransferase